MEEPFRKIFLVKVPACCFFPGWRDSRRTSFDKQKTSENCEAFRNYASDQTEQSHCIACSWTRARFSSNSKHWSEVGVALSFFLLRTRQAWIMRRRCAVPQSLGKTIREGIARVSDNSGQHIWLELLPACAGHNAERPNLRFRWSQIYLSVSRLFRSFAGDCELRTSACHSVTCLFHLRSSAEVSPPPPPPSLFKER